jgi:hypothetical protein
MIERDGPKVRVVNNVASTPSFTLRWLPEFTFNSATLSSDERARLQSLSGVEVDFIDTHDHKGFVKDFLRVCSGHRLLIELEHMSAPRRPVRSHKGLFYDAPTIRSGHLREYQIDIDARNTHFVGMAQIEPANLIEAVAHFGDGMRSFILLSDQEQTMTRELAQHVLGAVPKLPGGAYMNYAELASRFCDERTAVMRMAGYGNDGDAALQFFTTHARALGLAASLRDLARDAEVR